MMVMAITVSCSAEGSNASATITPAVAINMAY